MNDKDCLLFEERDDIVRDGKSRAVLNVNQDEYLTRKRQKELQRKRKMQEEIDRDRMDKLESQVNGIENKMDQILSLLINNQAR